MQPTIILQKYDAFIRQYQKEPKVVKTTVEWQDDKHQHDYLISLDDYWADDFANSYRKTEIGFLNEEDIFYHAGNIQGLCNLIISDCEDFKVLDVIDFY